MTVQRYGWPLSVLERKMMWWDWSDPTLNGPESSPSPALLLPGLILNPLIVAVALLFFVFVSGCEQVDPLVAIREQQVAGNFKESISQRS